jgi:hypothetical protein
VLWGTRGRQDAAILGIQMFPRSRSMDADRVIQACPMAARIRVLMNIALALCLTAGAPPLAVAAAQPSRELAAKSTDAEEIVRQAAQGPVRVIVSYRPSDASTNGAPVGSQSDAGRIEANHLMQDAIIADHFGSPATLGPERALRRLDVTPAFAINASLAEIEALARDDRVLHIALDAARRPSR